MAEILIYQVEKTQGKVAHINGMQSILMYYAFPSMTTQNVCCQKCLLTD